jgi:hypothetical protein
MGMQYIELIMNLEEALSLDLPDAAYEAIETVGQLRTVGDLVDFIVPLVHASQKNGNITPSELEASVLQTVCEHAAKLAHGVKPSQITRETRFIEDLGFG